MSKKLSRRPVLVTTLHRGVFFGYVEGPATTRHLHLYDGRNCLYWSVDVKGFLGLAATGPSASCRVGPKADMFLRDITSVTAVTPEAVLRWEQGPWA